jgi:hypothetical protein
MPSGAGGAFALGEPGIDARLGGSDQAMQFCEDDAAVNGHQLTDLVVWRRLRYAGRIRWLRRARRS